MNKQLATKLLFIFLLLFGLSFAHNAYASATCSQADVQAEVNTASTTAGYVVHIPAGNCAWTSPVIVPITADISIIGAGVGNTIITDNGTSTTLTGRLFHINSGAGKNIRISSMTLKTMTVTEKLFRIKTGVTTVNF